MHVPAAAVEPWPPAPDQVDWTSVTGRDKDWRTQLHVFAYYGNLTAVRGLLAAGARIGARDTAQWTPLHAAASAGRTAVVEEVWP